MVSAFAGEDCTANSNGVDGFRIDETALFKLLGAALLPSSLKSRLLRFQRNYPIFLKSICLARSGIVPRILENLDLERVLTSLVAGCSVCLPVDDNARSRVLAEKRTGEAWYGSKYCPYPE